MCKCRIWSSHSGGYEDFYLLLCKCFKAYSWVFVLDEVTHRTTWWHLVTKLCDKVTTCHCSDRKQLIEFCSGPYKQRLSSSSVSLFCPPRRQGAKSFVYFLFLWAVRAISKIIGKRMTYLRFSSQLSLENRRSARLALRRAWATCLYNSHKFNTSAIGNIC
jgi:hypothetical protein